MKLIFSFFISSLSLFALDSFISAEYLHQHINDTNLVLIDTTDSRTFKKGHIQNAIQADISLFRHKVNNTYALMNDTKVIEDTARKLGINNNSKVIIYGHHKKKELLKSSYMALALISNGFTNVALLNGGYEEWKDEYDDEKDAISKKINKISQGNFRAKPNKNILVDLQYVLQHIHQVPMIEARPKTYFTGEKHSKGVKRVGHISGAQSSFWRDKFNLDDTLKSKKDLNKIFIDSNHLNKDKELITYCTGGLEASMNWYILSQYLHFKNVKLYDASMKQWGNIDTTPMEK